MSKKTYLLPLALSALVAANFVHAGACTSADESLACAQVHGDIERIFKPAPENNYGRYRSALAIAANKKRLAVDDVYRYNDFGPIAYGEGQLWLTLPEPQRSQAFDIPPKQIRQWLINKSKVFAQSKYLALTKEIRAFAEVDHDTKMLWMTLSPADRIKASGVPLDQRRSYVAAHSQALNYGSGQINALIDNWNLF